MTTIVLIAKQPVPGRVKTRLTPAVSFEQAAQLAAASIDDTLRALAAVPATRRVLFYDGQVLPVGSDDYEVIAQPTGSLDLRLGHIFDRLTGPVVLVGMDTPQVTASDLAVAFPVWPDDIDACFGPASDGGFWALGMREPRGDLIRGIPMSQDDTGIRQLDRLVSAGLSVSVLREHTDVDTIADAHEVAAVAPHTFFARRLRGIDAMSGALAGAVA